MERIDFSVLGATGGGVIAHIPAPYRCTIQKIQASPDADPGDAETLTVKSGSNTVGVLTFGTDIAAGATGTYVKNSTYGETVFEKDDIIKVEASTLTAAASFKGYIEIDPHARTTQ